MAHKSIKTKKRLTFQETLKCLLEEETAAYNKAGIFRQFVIVFPNRQKAPLLGRIGVKLISMVGGIIQIQYERRDNQ